MDNRWAIMVEGRFEFGFAVDWMRKDLGLVLDAARSNGSRLALTALVDQFYRNGGYEGTLNYAAEPDPPLLGADNEWADAHLRAQGLRPRTKPTRRKRRGK